MNTRSHKHLTNDDRLEEIRRLIELWAAKQSHDRCWYYPDIFPKSHF